MSAELREAAFHEAGHCYVARRDVGRIVDWMHIYHDDYGWGGTTHIDPDFQNLLSWTTITVAGIVAEAKADAIQRFARDERLQINDRLVDDVKEYVNAVLVAGKKGQKIKPAQVTFRTLAGNEGVSSISPDDVRRIAPFYRDWLSLRTALENAERICHNPDRWIYIERLADVVMGAKENCIFSDEIDAILGLR